MIYSVKKYLELTGLVFKHGQLGHSGENFNQNREESLRGLEEFIPIGRVINTSSISKNAIIRNLMVQLAFVKNSLKIKGGHLTVNNLSYIRIPKSASTSMSKEMLEKIYTSLKQKVITEKQINFLTDVNLQDKIGESSIIFTIVRNPFSRLVSVYRDFFENKNNYIYSDYLFGILQAHVSFSEFVDRIASIPNHLKDQHIRPQHTFLKYYEKKNLNIQVFKLEDSEKINQFLTQFDMQLPHLNKSERSYDYRSYYDAKTLNKVRVLYKIDVERFGYESVLADRQTVH